MHLLARTSLASANFLHRANRLLQSNSQNYVGEMDGPRVPTRGIDVRRLIRALKLPPATSSFICCSKCFHLHHEWNPQASFILCQNIPDPSQNQSCGTHLVIRERRMVVQSLINWIGRMLSRVDIEHILEDQSYQERPKKFTVTEALDAKWARELTGPSGRPFFPSLRPELHLLLSLNVDSFNPFGMKPAGVHYSATGVYMTLMSLPAGIRYRKENTFFYTLTPGPGAPHNDDINSILAPLVAELEALWTGIYISETAKLKKGRIVRAAMGCLVCDLLAALQVAGLGDHSRDSFPCAFCKIRGRDMKQGNVKAPLRTRTELEALAREWHDLDTSEKRKKHFERYSVRYSVLSRLPYYDITRSKVIDSMHTHLLDQLERHINGLLGMDSRVPDASEISMPPMLSEADLFDAECILRDGSTSKIISLGRKAIVSLCSVRGLRFAGSIPTLVDTLVVRRSSPVLMQFKLK